MNHRVWTNIRGVLGHMVGQKIIDITQHDSEEYEQDGKTYIMFMLEGGDYFKVFLSEEGFDCSMPEPNSDSSV